MRSMRAKAVQAETELDDSLPTLDDPVETSAFQRLVVRAVRQLGAKRVLDVGCGTGLPTMAAARAGAARVIGIDIAEQNVALARENIRAAGLSKVVSAHWASWEEVASGAFPVGDVDLVVGNPPYVPQGEGSAVDGGPTGTRLLDAIVDGVPQGVRGLALLFGSLSDPLHVLTRIERRGFHISQVYGLSVAFGRYTSRPRTLAELKRRRMLGTAWFCDAKEQAHLGAPHEYLTLGVIAERNGAQRAGPWKDMYRAMAALLERYQFGGAAAIARSSVLARL